MTVIIGVDPHKASHTAFAVSEHEDELGHLQVRANKTQTARLLEWAAPFTDRMWAIEGAGGWGYLLAQQLIAAGETVVDVPATLAARVRVLGSGKSNKNDPNDARSVAIAALRAPKLTAVRAADHAEVLAVLARRHKQLASARTRVACRLHAVLADLIEGGTTKKLKAERAEQLLASLVVSSPVEQAKLDIARDHLADLRRVDDQLAQSRQRVADAVEAAKTTVTDVVGVGPLVAAMCIGYSGDIRRFASRDHFAAYCGTAPVELSSGDRVIHRLSRRGNRQLNHAMHLAALSQIRHPHTAGRIYYDRKISEGKTKKEAFRALKRRVSDAVYRQLLADANSR